MSEYQFVYRALTKERVPTDKSFRLRPNERFLSIAATKEKAMGSLRCKGWAELERAKIEAMGLIVRMKTIGQPDPEDPELLEISGLPSSDSSDEEITNFAIGLARAVSASGAVS